jgi:2-dehydro-3-deoxy-D-gluconate 5-dehydrogenase
LPDEKIILYTFNKFPVHRKETFLVAIVDSFRLGGKAALVTGAGRGLGRAMAVALADAGADIAGLSSSGDCPETRREIENKGRRFLSLQADLRQTTVKEMKQLVDRVVEELGQIDILVNNAGMIRRAPALEFAEADWDDILQVNLKSVFFLSQAAAAHMVRRGGGKIIHVASVLSFQGGITIPAYTAAKSGVAGLTRALANEWAKYRINVNAIAPGYMVTDNTAALRADAKRSQAILDRIPAGRWGEPEDLMGAVVFLASSASDYVHGAVLSVDGGWLSR